MSPMAAYFIFTVSYTSLLMVKMYTVKNVRINVRPIPQSSFKKSIKVAYLLFTNIMHVMKFQFVHLDNLKRAITCVRKSPNHLHCIS